jgi:hypothetical protein
LQVNCFVKVAGIFKNGEILLHKSFSKYITRKKQGKRQSKNDSDGRAQSAGNK